MGCTNIENDCAPCTNCEPSPEPVLPNCNFTYPDGRYDNATIVVEGGCIVAIEAGRVPQYTPDVCCMPVGGGGGGGPVEPCDCPPGQDGENATISIGEVVTLDPTSKAYVNNIGTETHAVLNFGIPAGAKGESGASARGINSDVAGFTVEQGAITMLPITWPPALYFVAESDRNDVKFEISAPSQENGFVTATLQMTQYDVNIKAYIAEQIQQALIPIQTQITALQGLLQGLQSQINSLDSRVTALERKSTS